MVCSNCECALERCTVSYAITQRSSSDVTARSLMAYGANGASKPKLPPSTQTKDPSGTLTACNVLTPPLLPAASWLPPPLRFMSVKEELMCWESFGGKWLHLLAVGHQVWMMGWLHLIALGTYCTWRDQLRDFKLDTVTVGARCMLGE